MARMLGPLTLLGTVVMLAAACEPTTPSPRASATSPAGRDAYLCCTMRFNASREASDANYDYREKVVFPAGTHVHDLRVTSSAAEFVPEGDTKTYRLEYRYGRKAISPSDYFDRIFVGADPTARLAADAPLRAAIRDGRLLPGMTKWEAITVRGFPPAHHTPSTDADDWLYYASYDRCERVRFVDGRIASIEQVPPPS